MERLHSFIDTHGVQSQDQATHTFGFGDGQTAYVVVDDSEEGQTELTQLVDDLAKINEPVAMSELVKTKTFAANFNIVLRRKDGPAKDCLPIFREITKAATHVLLKGNDKDPVYSKRSLPNGTHAAMFATEEECCIVGQVVLADIIVDERRQEALRNLVMTELAKDASLKEKLDNANLTNTDMGAIFQKFRTDNPVSFLLGVALRPGGALGPRCTHVSHPRIYVNTDGGLKIESTPQGQGVGRPQVVRMFLKRRDPRSAMSKLTEGDIPANAQRDRRTHSGGSPPSTSSSGRSRAR